MRVIKYNAVDYILENDDCMLIHVCNDVGVMGSGIALEIKNKIPSAYTNYKKGDLILGNVNYSNNYKVANMIAQNKYNGYKGVYNRNFCYLDYEALEKCLKKIKEESNCSEIVLPYKMGAQRAGGDWNTVLSLVEDILSDKFEIIICKL